ncbi:unnamed protein product [Bursaphelenchus xylophilus]|uniref:(pine wood nematode) hypothetical protein n=1 Tax=Bursaphelenchus xylophilus TaxID=6326 RepID=A0A1I7S0P4_BURXY|nr:unnamed protein product [Bursaphelenchus xylophilus]CAG9088215.1 unnamed protein product [Bursaphelenchus xylophilus]
MDRPVDPHEKNSFHDLPHFTEFASAKQVHEGLKTMVEHPGPPNQTGGPLDYHKRVLTLDVLVETGAPWPSASCGGPCGNFSGARQDHGPPESAQGSSGMKKTLTCSISTDPSLNWARTASLSCRSNARTTEAYEQQ